MKGEHTVKLLCYVLSVSRSGYYEWLDRLSDQSLIARNKLLVEKVVDSYNNSRGTYGHRIIRDDLIADSFNVSFREVLQVMQSKGLEATPVKRRRTHKAAGAKLNTVAPNRLSRKFNPKKPDRYWVGDITYIWTDEGWMYLAVVIDLFSRRIVGWALSETQDTQLIIKALQQALSWRNPRRWRIMFHSDQGCQYTSIEFCQTLKDYGILQSMSRKGQCWDNAVVESLFGTFKQETGVNKWSLSTKYETRELVLDWIENWYNTKRKHSTLGLSSPAKFEEMYAAA